MSAGDTTTHVYQSSVTVSDLHPILQHVWVRHDTHTWLHKAHTCTVIRQSGCNLIRASHMCREEVDIVMKAV